MQLIKKGVRYVQNVSQAMRLIKGMNTNEKQTLEELVQEWLTSPARELAITGERYYRGEHDILKRKRTVIGAQGRLIEVDNLPNNRVIDNQYAKMVDQKTNYLLGNPLTIDTEDEAYRDALAEVFGKKFNRLLQNLCEDALNGGVGWLHVYYDEQGLFKFKRFAPYEILPIWRDDEHTELDSVIRVYESNDKNSIDCCANLSHRIEYYTIEGVRRYVMLDSGALIDDPDNPHSSYINLDNEVDQSYKWGRLPIIAFKYNDKELPLISKVKSLQDGINTLLSDFENNLQEDSRNTILVLKNLDGTDLNEFRHNLATFGAIKVRTTSDGADCGVETLKIEVNHENYRVLHEMFKNALIENAMGYDAKDDRMRGTPNQMNIQSMYSDIDLDANGMETEFQAAIENLLWFVNIYLANIFVGDFRNLDVRVLFKRDMLMNQEEIVGMAVKSVGLISNETIVSHHPWVQDASQELERLDNEKSILWQQRFMTLEQSLHDRSERFFKSLAIEYDRAASKIKKDITVWYERLASNNGVSLLEARKLLKDNTLKEFKWTVEEYVRHDKENALNQRWIKELENASVRVHISNLEAINLQMRQHVEVLYNDEHNRMTSHMRDIFSDDYYHTVFEIQRGAGIGFAIRGLDEKKIERVISTPWTTYGRTFSDRIWANKVDLIQTLKTELTQSLIRGDNPKKIADTIAKKFDVKKYQAKRLVMTESAYFASAGEHESFKELDVGQYQFLATLDNKTSEICRDMDLKVFKLSEYEIGVTAPPLHSFCRSTTVPYIEEDYGERAARNNDNKTFHVSSDMSYREWKEAYVEGQK